MNPLMLLLLALPLLTRMMGGAQGNARFPGARDPLGAAMPGQRPAGPFGNGPGGATLPPQGGFTGYPNAQATHGLLQGFQGSQGPYTGGIASLLNAMGKYPQQQQQPQAPFMGNQRAW